MLHIVLSVNSCSFQTTNGSTIMLHHESELGIKVKNILLLLFLSLLIQCNITWEAAVAVIWAVGLSCRPAMSQHKHGGESWFTDTDKTNMRQQWQNVLPPAVLKNSSHLTTSNVWVEQHVSHMDQTSCALPSTTDHLRGVINSVRENPVMWNILAKCPRYSNYTDTGAAANGHFNLG